MRNIVLAVVLICALTAAGVGGTLAGFSDSEICYDNYIQTGSLDLKVNGEDDEPWGDGIYGKVVLVDIWPCQEHPVIIDLHNAGQGPEDKTAYLYIQFKKLVCWNVPPDKPGAYEDPNGKMKPEPELVAEYGGYVDQVWIEEDWRVPDLGDGCSMRSCLDVEIIYEGETIWGPGAIGVLMGKQLYLGELPPCHEAEVELIFHVPQIEDEHWVEHGIPEKFKDWPTNALMKDAISFDMEFDLLQHQVE